MRGAPPNESMTDAQLETLADILDSRPGAMNLEMLDGFFAALICAPRLVMPSEYLPLVWGDAEFNDLAEIQEAAGLVMQLWNHIADVLGARKQLQPFLMDVDGEGGSDWAAGFLSGSKLAGVDWVELMQDEDMATWLQPFFLLAFKHDPDPELRGPIITPENRDMLLTAMMLAVERIYDYFAPHRGRPAAAAAIRRGRMPAKPGRNAACPCGSGLKYKRCCGK